MNNKISSIQQTNLRLTVLSLAVIVSLTGCEQGSKNAVEKQEAQADNAAQVTLSDKQRSELQVQKKQRQNAISYAAIPQGMMQQSVVMQRSGLQLQPMPPAPVDDMVFDSKEDRENYLKSQQNPVKQTTAEPVSTFSIDVDTGSYSNTRRMLNMGKLPPSDAVREEAFINYFDYDYNAPETISTPFKVHTEVATALGMNIGNYLKLALKALKLKKQI